MIFQLLNSQQSNGLSISTCVNNENIDDDIIIDANTWHAMEIGQERRTDGKVYTSCNFVLFTKNLLVNCYVFTALPSVVNIVWYIKVWYYIKKNNEIVKEKVNETPVTFNNLHLWASDNTYRAATDVTVKKWGYLSG